MGVERVTGAARSVPPLLGMERGRSAGSTTSRDRGSRRGSRPTATTGRGARCKVRASSEAAAATTVSEVHPASAAGSPKICIVGGGFGGLYTALRLTTLVWPGKSKPEITLVDQRDRFVFKPLLYELLTEELDLDEVAPRFVDVLSRTGVNFVQGKVAETLPKGEGDGARGKVELESGEVIEYDYLVMALGSGTRLDMVEGAKEHALPFCNLEDALSLKGYLRGEAERGRKPTLAVVGGGVNGVELAASLVDKYGDRVLVQLMTPGSDILESYPKEQRQNAWNTLSLGKVDVRLGTKVTKIEAGAEGGKYSLSIENVESGEGVVEVDKILWTAGQKPASVGSSPPGATSGSFLKRNEGGSVVTDGTLRMLDSSYVFALGDVAVQEGEQQSKYSLTAQVAFQQSDYVAWNVWSSINKQPLLPFQYQHLGDMMSLGQNEATVGLPVGGLNLTGLPASLLRKTAYIYRMPTLEYSARLGLTWAARLLRGQVK
ncbi:pyridine nucleotide-disulfide oxidoreductase [Chloropicon primus]|uniref:Pyridine nucleotide-disulfide oxidoreductase n=2 Tax=Chloropicon primus TaxID=1764295 RepID=A0A5B8MCC1_9CHLO|nr:pyridine nucleotide-disulfide oxidoreductase [Chloropicon primus]UPQ97248.1 pyridine nucleotide-disulfide oxidoreductase [Chloropicon primus]|eukprot:QDZ18033.1 pyridine nucleotide-disulfide oxidoreductase [Chloropicon primus]